MATRMNGRRRRPDRGRRPPEQDERTDELTGTDASVDEAEIGDAGNGVDPWGGDLSGLPRRFEVDPNDPGDILPDQIRRFARTPRFDEDRELTAQPREAAPFEPSELP